jgi:hypothetical protein
MQDVWMQFPTTQMARTYTLLGDTGRQRSAGCTEVGEAGKTKDPTLGMIVKMLRHAEKMIFHSSHESVVFTVNATAPFRAFLDSRYLAIVAAKKNISPMNMH